MSQLCGFARRQCVYNLHLNISFGDAQTWNTRVNAAILKPATFRKRQFDTFLFSRNALILLSKSMQVKCFQNRYKY